jgi:hypothetical protein
MLIYLCNGNNSQFRVNGQNSAFQIAAPYFDWFGYLPGTGRGWFAQ